MNDLYYQLKETAQQNGITIELIPSNRQSIAEMMPDFQKKSSMIRMKLQLIRNNNEEISRLTEVIQTAASTQKEKESMKKVDQLQGQINKNTTEIKKLFEEIDKLVKEGDPDEPETRAMIYNQKAIQQEVASILQSGQNTIFNYNKTIQKKMKRQLEILEPNLTEKQKTDIISDPQGLEKMVLKETLGQPSLQLVYRVQDIQDKFQDIQKLEKSTQYCFQMLSEIAFLVNQQGEQIESIEQNLNKAKNYIEKGEKKLAKEQEIHKKSRKKMCCIILIGLIAIGVITTPIILKFVKSSG
ncbi:unnamed protein product [Paramecium pentaurelia]|uniref:t-SNARE coiled-coil homology domain-containing protein n=1 Tax=Paramecium pentaurelia TaxID=43138 RepID=A0A8S1XIY7_9CILI|nr:unnamed protein product [Paramecium pentaurelia]